MSTELALAERLARIEAKLDMYLKKADDHESRIRRLERALWIVTGFAAALGGGIGSMLTRLLGG